MERTHSFGRLPKSKTLIILEFKSHKVHEKLGNLEKKAVLQRHKTVYRKERKHKPKIGEFHFVKKFLSHIYYGYRCRKTEGSIACDARDKSSGRSSEIESRYLV